MEKGLYRRSNRDRMVWVLSTCRYLRISSISRSFRPRGNRLDSRFRLFLSASDLSRNFFPLEPVSSGGKIPLSRRVSETIDWDPTDSNVRLRRKSSSTGACVFFPLNAESLRVVQKEHSKGKKVEILVSKPEISSSDGCEPASNSLSSAFQLFPTSRVYLFRV